jgi:hypothetical protein
VSDENPGSAVPVRLSFRASPGVVGAYLVVGDRRWELSTIPTARARLAPDDFDEWVNTMHDAVRHVVENGLGGAVVETRLEVTECPR